MWLQHFKDLVVAWCSSNSLVLYAALVILPGFGFPASILLILAGVVWGASAKTCAIVLSAMALNLLWTRGLAAGPGKAIISRMLGKRWGRLENLPPADLYRLTCILRVTPGLPLFLQNYILGVLGVPLRPYLLISIPLMGFWVIGIVITGGAIFQGSTGTTIAGASILLVGVLILRFIRSGMGTVNQSKAGSEASRLLL